MITFNFVIETKNFEFSIHSYSRLSIGTSLYNKAKGYYLNDIEFDYCGHWEWVQHAYKSNADYVYRQRWDLINKTGCSIDESISKIPF